MASPVSDLRSVLSKAPLLVGCLLVACGGHGASTSSTTGGPGASSSTGSTGRSSGAGSTGAGSNGTAASSSSGVASSGASSTGGSSSGAPVPCGPGAVWQGESCVLLGCAGALSFEQCQLPDGGIGSCAGGACQSIDYSSDPTNCGGYGFQCPSPDVCSGDTCVDPTCAGTACPPPCSNGACPSGLVCLLPGNSCVLASCSPSTTDRACLGDAGVGFCCGDECLSVIDDDPANCGACGHSCGEGGLCIHGNCQPGAQCDAGEDNSLCARPQGSGFCCQGSCEASAPPDCGACGLSCTTCQSDSDCPTGQACAAVTHALASTAQASCAPLSCAGAAEGVACAIPGLVFPGSSLLLDTNVHGAELVVTECCWGACVDLDFDPSNCGACGIACPAATTCEFGTCQPSVDCAQAADGTLCAASPTAAGECCGGSCVNSASDNANCWRCGMTCPPGTNCLGEYCIDSDGGLSEPQAPSSCVGRGDSDFCATPDGGGACCAGTCVGEPNLSSCAECGLGCPNCFGGCPGGTACVYDALGAGGPGPTAICEKIGCSGEGDLCAFGQRQPVVTTVVQLIEGALGSAACCSGTCVDTTQDPLNCGTCGVACASGICAFAGASSSTCFLSQPDTDCLETCGPLTVCVRGTCVDSSCDASLYCAAEDGSVGICCSASPFGRSPFACSDLANDPLNCGGCGFACPPGQSCSQGACGGTPADCAHRIGGFCDLDAGLGYLCCPGVGCTNTETDASNCGTCGTICPAGMSCQSGSCQ